eukprot:TRINITY_DN30843_c0_g1_i1.p1 TRINITY_DN30843_c0_g1~~TRINITY_DN30843_c0_g1_i1.p1  ORF type:complete len:367 (+),score=71.02 TRINITY_DN30843_c0_g1_i1:41-1102(+)
MTTEPETPSTVAIEAERKADDTSEYGTDEVRSEGESSLGKKEKEVAVPWIEGDFECITLDQEIECFAKFIGLNTQEKVMRQMARSVIQQAASYFWASSTVKVYGSHACGLSLPSSELDLVVESCGTYLTGYTEPFKSYLYALGLRTSCVLEGATDAFVKVTDSRTGLVINITLTTHTSPVRYAVARMRKIFAEQPAAGGVLFVLRTVLNQCSLTDVASGGVSGYALSLMVFHILRKYEGVKVAPGDLLKDFLQTYGSSFDFSTTSVNPLDEFQTLLASGAKLHPNDPVSICDLADPTTNAADALTKISQIKAMLRYLLLALQKWDSAEMADCRGKTPLSTIIAHKQLWQRVAK